MAYNRNGSGQGQQQGNGNNYSGGGQRQSGGGGGGGGGKSKNRVFTAFMAKSGKGYTANLEEAVTIPAGSRVGVFMDQITSKKTGQTYDVVNVTILPNRPKPE